LGWLYLTGDTRLERILVCLYDHRAFDVFASALARLRA
jgi:hypothetical protein